MFNTQIENGLYIVKDGQLIKAVSAPPYGEAIVRFQEGKPVFYSTTVSNQIKK